jgi:hypothetical protein
MVACNPTLRPRGAKAAIKALVTLAPESPAATSTCGASFAMGSRAPSSGVRPRRATGWTT